MFFHLYTYFLINLFYNLGKEYTTKFGLCSCNTYFNIQRIILSWDSQYLFLGKDSSYSNKSFTIETYIFFNNVYVQYDDIIFFSRYILLCSIEMYHDKEILFILNNKHEIYIL